MSAAMTRKEREDFLSEVHIGVLAVENDGRPPLAVPIWYIYNPGRDFWMTTGGKSRKGKLLKQAGRASICVQAENPPYRYVSVEGPVTIERANTDKDTRQLAHRYLGVEGGNAYIAAMRDFMESQEPILVRLRPERWLTFDSSKEKP